MNPFRENYLREVRGSEKQKLEAHIVRQIAAHQIQGVERNFKFLKPTRLLEFDFAVPPARVALEVQGGIFGRQVICNHCHKAVLHFSAKMGRWIAVREGYGHSNGMSIERDIEKLNLAQAHGWFVVLCSPAMAADGSATLLFKNAIEHRKQFGSSWPEGQT